jgi:hypothetical protein
VVGRERRVTHVRPALRIACCHDHAWPEHVIIKEGRSERIGSMLSRNLRGRVNGGCRIVDRSRVSDRLTRSSDRLGANSGLPVAAKPESLEASEQTAMLLGSAGGRTNRDRSRAGGWCTNRGRSRAGGWCTHRHRAGGWCTGTLLFVASLSIASQNQRPDQSAQNQSQ